MGLPPDSGSQPACGLLRISLPHQLTTPETTIAPGAGAPGRTAIATTSSSRGSAQFTCAGCPVTRAFGHHAQHVATADGLWLSQKYALPTAPPNQLARQATRSTRSWAVLRQEQRRTAQDSDAGAGSADADPHGTDRQQPGAGSADGKLARAS